MVDVARVKMFGLPIGTFRWDEGYGVAQFEYDQSFIGKGIEPSPLMMPVREGRVYSFAGLNRETYMGLPGMLADTPLDMYGCALYRQRKDMRMCYFGAHPHISVLLPLLL
jgi:serine/threonine-protein kinase HipA